MSTLAAPLETLKGELAALDAALDAGRMSAKAALGHAAHAGMKAGRAIALEAEGTASVTAARARVRATFIAMAEELETLLKREDDPAGLWRTFARTALNLLRQALKT